ncbi:hypothetical protein EQG49_00160 [Periweissella cryptocerci]|uniref:SpaA-like prealbumin fold domain-containing protein n=1 Tax=Periweissella cryptocerci TaxID=2506420 RepID=A0A4P6YQT6_9LACO|nr:SpaA isopeptide-forming pilin-related protein [Periweissella cryptocerci]QBO34967.1 hypothetical protein EQG49_00160 [Periweissella cryptocerci]
MKINKPKISLVLTGMILASVLFTFRVEASQNPSVSIAIQKDVRTGRSNTFIPLNHERYTIKQVVATNNHQIVLKDSKSFSFTGFTKVITTDVHGHAELTDRDGMTPGTYVVFENKSKLVKAPMEPVLVSLPLKVNGKSSYHVELIPKSGLIRSVPLEKPIQKLGQIKIQSLIKGTNKPLSGIKLKLALSKKDAMNGVFVQRNGRDYTVTADRQGFATFQGLSKAKYWLVESKGVNGYRLLTKASTVYTSFDITSKTVKVYSAKEQTLRKLAQTGFDMKRNPVLLTIGAIGMVLGMVMLFLNRKREEI